MPQKGYCPGMVRVLRMHAPSDEHVQTRHLISFLVVRPNKQSFRSMIQCKANKGTFSPNGTVQRCQRAGAYAQLQWVRKTMADSPSRPGGLPWQLLNASRAANTSTFKVKRHTPYAATHTRPWQMWTRGTSNSSSGFSQTLALRRRTACSMVNSCCLTLPKPCPASQTLRFLPSKMRERRHQGVSRNVQT